MKKIVVLGGGGHAKIVITILKKTNKYKITGYTDCEDKGQILGINYLGDDSILIELKSKNKNCTAVIGVGSVKVDEKRKIIKEKLERLGFELPVIISPEAIINEEVEIGRGTVVMDGAIIDSGSKIMEAVIINKSSTIGHDCIIGNYTHVALGATLGGSVEVGENCLIGIGANIIQYVKITKDCLIGAGATVVNDILEPGNYIGIPAKKIK